MSKPTDGRGTPRDAAPAPPMADYRHHGARRKNNPPAKIAAEGTVPVIPKAQYAYNPHLPPVLRFDPAGGPDKLPDLLAKARRGPLSDEEARLLAEALRVHEPWLEWTGKREKRGFEVDPVALHIHERISTQAILRVAARQDVQRSLFADPQQEYHEAVQFYRHDVDWANRLILGDSLQVMSSLARREDLAGKVQMIYIDPPYGIKFASNFQPEVSRREVRDKQEDLTREPEMVRAYRDTWHLGMHSYLSYLRDRLIVARELLTDTGSIFVQIGAENVHRVRVVMDEVFDAGNFVSLITVRKTATPSNMLDDGAFYLLWYARSVELARKTFRSLHRPKPCDEWARDTPGGSWRVEIDGVRRALTPEEKQNTKILPPGAQVYCLSKTTSAGAASNPETWEANGVAFSLKSNEHWKTGPKGRERLLRSERVEVEGRPWFTKFYSDGQFKRMNNVWEDTAGKSGESLYVVQTQLDVVARCMLMTTDPGDLVLDPTCGSGTTAYVAEQWGRRWITIDTSRVAVAIARQRILTAKFEMYRLRPLTADDTARNPHGTWLRDPENPTSEPLTFQCKSVPHVTLKSIAQNVALDAIFAKHDPTLSAALKTANEALGAALKRDPAFRTRMAAKLDAKQQQEGKRAITDADRRRWILPPDNRERGVKYTVDASVAHWYPWEVPFDTDEEWPSALRDAVNAYRRAWSAKVAEVNACIAASAEQEELTDKPEPTLGVTRVSGPFTVEAVQPPEMCLGDNIDPHTGREVGEGGFGGEPQVIPAGFEPRTLRLVEPRAELEVANVTAYLQQMLHYLKADGVRFLNNRQMKWTRLEPLFESGRSHGFHAEGRWVTVGDEDSDPDGPNNVGVVFGPQYGPVTAKMIEELVKPAGRLYDHLVVAAFNFTAEAQAILTENPHPKLKIHFAHVRPDINPAMNGLLKESATPGGGQLFTVFGLPRVRIESRPSHDGRKEYTVTMEGVDVYNPVDNSINSTGASKVAAWFLDGDYDGRTFCVTQAFFPDKSAWEKLARVLNGKDGPIDAQRFEAFSSTTSLPFPAGKHRAGAVKVIDPRGNEVMSVHRLD